MLAAFKQDGLALRYGARALRADLQIVLAAFKLNGAAFEFASGDLQVDAWLQRPSKRPKLSLLRDTKDAKLQAKVDLSLTTHDDSALRHWIYSWYGRRQGAAERSVDGTHFSARHW